MKSFSLFVSAGVLLTSSLFSSLANAVIIGGVDFPQGAVSFADSVTSFTPNIAAGQPTAPFLGADNALGVPDYDSNNACPSVADCTFVSLGDGGSLVLQFVDNLLTGSDSNAFDLWIFEIGPDVEDTFVDISVDGITWLSVGGVGGATAGIDLDAFGYDSSFSFAFVRLTDDTNEGGQSGNTVGADIDAVGAISTITVDVPSPSIFILFALSVLAVFVRRIL